MFGFSVLLKINFGQVAKEEKKKSLENVKLTDVTSVTSADCSLKRQELRDRRKSCDDVTTEQSRKILNCETKVNLLIQKIK